MTDFRNASCEAYFQSIYFVNSSLKYFPMPYVYFCTATQIGNKYQNIATILFCMQTVACVTAYVLCMSP